MRAIEVWCASNKKGLIPRSIYQSRAFVAMWAVIHRWKEWQKGQIEIVKVRLEVLEADAEGGVK